MGILVILIPFNQFQSSPLEPLQTLAVQLDGRKKPLDTVARETVAQIHGRLNYQTTDGENLDYLQTYLSLWFNNRDWNEEPFILFSYRPLKEKVGLDPEKKYFTFVELMESNLGSFVLATREKQINNQELNRDEREALAIEERLALIIDTVGQNTLPLVPHPTDIKGTWASIPLASEYYPSSEIESLLTTYATLKQSYQIHPQKSSLLGEVARQLQIQLRSLSPNIYPTPATLKREVSFYKLHPFGKAWKLYAIAFSVMLIVLLFPAFNFYWGSLGIFIAGLLIHSYGFIERMQIAGRPPVTNMYESVIWVGFGIGAIALLFELIYRAKNYLLAAAPLSVFCLLLADSLPAVLDPSIKPLVPVLRDNFWLSIHVPTITLSYASFALAFALGHILLGHYLFTPQAKERINSLANCLKDFGFTVTSVLSFNAVLMAWYEVNFVLGTGLHSYGFSTGGSELIVGSFIGLDLLFVLVVTIRHRGWLTGKQTVQPEDKTALVETSTQI